MEENKDKLIERNGLTTLNVLKENLMSMDLSHKKLCDINETIKLPIQLCEINLSNNKLTYVPQCIMDLPNLRKLDISSNNITYFDDTPNFCHIIEDLDISNNKLLGPPYWVWSESPKKLAKVNLSNNMNITSALEHEYFMELLQYRTLVKEIIMHNCSLNKHKKLLSTFSNAKAIQLGDSNLNFITVNIVEDVPFIGLDKCCDIEKLNVCNTLVNNVTPMIYIYESLKEIDLSHNKLSGLPKEFCTLENLEICLLSFNRLLYLPSEIVSMEKLKVLCLDSNELCVLPDNFKNLKNLKTLDLYDNNLYDVPDTEYLVEVDLAQNYLEEPENNSYIEKRTKIRLNGGERFDGRKPEIIHEESEHSSGTPDDELELLLDGCEINESLHEDRPPSSSSEDWDSEDWWIPHYEPRITNPAQSSWLTFIKQKMEAGNFCPFDMHTVPISETIKYQKMGNPYVIQEVPGQFDDYSEDES